MGVFLCYLYYLLAMNCPTCKQPVTTEHINVQKDFAWCTHCEKAFSISEQLSGESQKVTTQEVSAHFDLHSPPKGAWFTEGREQIKIGATTRSCMGIFLLFFAIFWWSILSTIFIADLEGPGDTFSIIFMIPFFIAGFVVLGLALMMLLGKEEVIIRGDEGIIFKGIGPIGMRKRFRWKEIDSIREEAYFTRNKSSTSTGYRLVLEGAKQVKFGSMWTEERRFYVLNAIRLALKGMKK